MTPELSAALQIIVNLLCEIRDILQRCCNQQQPAGCNPGGNVQAVERNLALTTTPQQLVGNNPNRVAFTIGNTLGTVEVRAATQPVGNVGGGGVAKIAAGGTAQFTAYQYPGVITNTWYVWSASGTPTIRIVEFLKEGGT